MSDLSGLRVIEGDFSAPADAAVAIVAARFNEFIVARLIDGAVDGLTRHGVARSQITLIRTPGRLRDARWRCAGRPRAGSSPP